jgi:hypothetical protein
MALIDDINRRYPFRMKLSLEGRTSRKLFMRGTGKKIQPKWSISLPVDAWQHELEFFTPE